MIQFTCILQAPAPKQPGQVRAYTLLQRAKKHKQKAAVNLVEPAEQPVRNPANQKHVSSYFLFLNDHLQTTVGKYKDRKLALALMWRKLSSQQKDTYRIRAARIRGIILLCLPIYLIKFRLDDSIVFDVPVSTQFILQFSRLTFNICHQVLDMPLLGNQ